MKFTLTTIFILTFILSFTLGCSVNPATGKSQIDPLPTSTEIAMGEDYAPQFLEAYGGSIPSPQIQKYVSDIGHSLAKVSERPDLPWEFFVLDSQVVNAFALPGGKVFISRGLLEKFDNEAQLAGVLGHEIGHVTADHISQRYLRAILFAAGSVAIASSTDSYDAQYFSDVLMETLDKGYSREDEKQADELGVRYMTRKEYNPVGQLQVMKVLKRAGGAGTIEFLSTHPLPSTRITNLEKIIYERYPDYGDVQRYRFNFKAFRQNVIEPLKQLPPPKHDPQKQS